MATLTWAPPQCCSDRYLRFKAVTGGDEAR
jgi:hypothetical protein